MAMSKSFIAFCESPNVIQINLLQVIDMKSEIKYNQQKILDLQFLR